MSLISMKVMQTNNKWCAHQLNSKFDKTLKIYLKVLSQFHIENDSLFGYLTLLSNKSFY
jgi:hypothetical protein